jgi:cellulose synthase/poly-beta-1,6-N-acetylglucosamine synthase-like glycosyltransferase
MILLTIALGIFVIGLWAQNLVDLAALVAVILRPARVGRRSAPAPAVPRLLFLVPAHNEEELIGHCVRSLISMEYPVESRRIVVIADNSSDRTATFAREAGAECVERVDATLRGKPHALAWALRLLGLTDVEACVIVDADTIVAPGFARGLAALAPLERIAVQANVGTMNEWDNWLTRLEGLLGRCRYEVTYRLRDAAGLHCPLTGNGMCIGRELLIPNGWQAFSLTENWELYARYTAEGIPVRYGRDAKLFMQIVRTMNQGQTQRARWLAGRTWVLRNWWRDILNSRNTNPLDKFATLTELASLSPVLHLTTAVAVALTALVLPGSAGFWIAAAALTSVASNVVATGIVLIRHPHPSQILLAFLRLPLYATWRASVAATTWFVRGPSEWLKTERHPV